jgi:hypothetical protein
MPPREPKTTRRRFVFVKLWQNLLTKADGNGMGLFTGASVNPICLVFTAHMIKIG